MPNVYGVQMRINLADKQNRVSIMPKVEHTSERFSRSSNTLSQWFVAVGATIDSRGVKPNVAAELTRHRFSDLGAYRGSSSVHANAGHNHIAAGYQRTLERNGRTTGGLHANFSADTQSCQAALEIGKGAKTAGTTIGPRKFMPK